MLLIKLINEEELATCQKKREKKERRRKYFELPIAHVQIAIISLKTKLSKSNTIKDHSTNEDRIMTTDRRTFMEKITPATGNYDVDHNSISKHKSKKKRGRCLLGLKIPNDDLGKN
jgi:hypothetical protein